MKLLNILTFLSIITYPIPNIRIGGQPIAIFLAIFALLYFVFGSRTRRINKFTIWPIIVILFCFALSSISSGMINGSFLINILAFYVIYFVYANIGMDVTSKLGYDCTVRSISRVLIASGMFLCVYGFYGYVTGKIGNEASAFWWATSKYWGIHYTEATRNADVHYIAFPLIALLCKDKKTLWHYIWIGLMGSALLLSMSRNCWLAFVVVLFILFMMKSNRSKNLNKLVIGLFVIISAYLVLQYFGMSEYFYTKVLSLFGQETSSSDSSSQRWKVILIALETIVSNPLGIGAEQMYKVLHEAGFRLNHAENTYLNIAAELGLASTIAYSYLLFKPVKEVLRIKSLKKNLTYAEKYVLLSFIYLIITLLFNTETINCYIWIIIGINWYLLSVSICNRKKMGDLNGNRKI